MTRQEHGTALQQVLELVATEGTTAMADAFATLLDIAMVGKYERTAPKLAEWLEPNVAEGLAVFMLPPAHRRRLRTINALENLHKEIKRRTRVATLFPNEASVLRLVSAVLCEIDEEWGTGRLYLSMETV